MDESTWDFTINLEIYQSLWVSESRIYDNWDEILLRLAKPWLDSNVQPLHYESRTQTSRPTNKNVLTNSHSLSTALQHYDCHLQVKSKKFEHHIKLPPGIVKKIEKQKGGIFPIITATEKEFGLEIKYVRDKHFIIFGPNADVLELMAQTLVLRYVIKVGMWVLEIP